VLELAAIDDTVQSSTLLTRKNAALDPVLDVEGQDWLIGTICSLVRQCFVYLCVSSIWRSHCVVVDVLRKERTVAKRLSRDVGGSKHKYNKKMEQKALSLRTRLRDSLTLVSNTQSAH